MRGNLLCTGAPLEALRTVLSLAAISIGDHRPDWNPNSPNRIQISLIDINRAYFNARVDRERTPVYVALPPEDSDSSSMCGELLRHMYGTRLAADGWQEEYSTMLIRLGFTQGVGHPNVFGHSGRDIFCSVHGDDFTSAGPSKELDWMEGEISKEYEITIAPRMGPGPDDAKEGRALNRVIKWHADKLTYEADPRLA